MPDKNMLGIVTLRASFPTGIYIIARSAVLHIVATSNSTEVLFRGGSSSRNRWQFQLPNIYIYMRRERTLGNTPEPHFLLHAVVDPKAKDKFT